MTLLCQWCLEDKDKIPQTAVLVPILPKFPFSSIFSTAASVFSEFCRIFQLTVLFWRIWSVNYEFVREIFRNSFLFHKLSYFPLLLPEWVISDQHEFVDLHFWVILFLAFEKNEIYSVYLIASSIALTCRQLSERHQMQRVRLASIAI